MKPVTKLSSFFPKPGLRSQSESGGPSRKQQEQLRPGPELMPQGKSLNIGVKKLPPAASPAKYDPSKLQNESDERYQYLLKRAILKRVENDEKILFAELPGLPGVLVVYRKPSERNANPERLNLDRRDLTLMPLLEGEDRLRLLNFQHNYISKIENLLSLPNLIFLDLYNNQVKEINNLNTVPTLRVLMLGKNLIERIKNLTLLTKLDVLDLHSNRIRKIENLSQLCELRVLNLANNLIEVFEGLEGLTSLSELNLRRNQIFLIKNSGLGKLQRLFLSSNNFADLESIENLALFPSLLELTLDGNSVQSLPSYTNWIVCKCPQLSHLDLKKVTPDMRDVIKPVKVEENSASSENLITVVSQEWKQEIERLSRFGGESYTKKKEVNNETMLQSGHAEIEGESILYIYGNALEIIAKPEFQDNVSAIFFYYIKFEDLIQGNFLNHLKRFQKLQKIGLVDNNFHSFTQIMKFECLSSLKSILIENNDVNFTSIFRTFLVYRFPGIEEINKIKVDENDKTRAKQQFQDFDRVISTNNLLKLTQINEDKETQKHNRINLKENSEFSLGYVRRIISHAIGNPQKTEVLSRDWNGFLEEIVKKTIFESCIPKVINDETVSSV